MLFIEDSIPDAITGQGFVRSSYIAEELRNLMSFTTLVGLNPPAEAKPAWARMPKAPKLEIRDDVTQLNFYEFLHDAAGVYQYIWLSRTHNIRFVADFLRAHPNWRQNIKIIVDTEAIGALRTASQARLLGVDVDLDALLSEELRGIEIADHICVVNELDKMAVQRYLEIIGVERPVSILGHALTVQDPLPAYEDTSQIVLTGSFASPTGPNADGLLWFDREVRPLLDEMLPDAEYVVAGYKAKIFCDQAGLAGRYTVMSDVKEMRTVYAKARLVVAPTRFAGGIPFKVHEAASYGVPVVMTELLAKQLGWRNYINNVIDINENSNDSALIISEIYNNQRMWQKAREILWDLVQNEWVTSLFKEKIKNVML
jgi:glycosyltransferase involved in cell wall biosynthesis